MTLKITDTGSLALTEAELNMMQRLLDAHDRGGFYMAFNAMTDSAEASLQGRISTFSGPVGGVALGANRLGQWFANLDGTQDPYPGIYLQSQAVAQSALNFIRADINASSDNEGLLTDSQFFQSAQAAWNATSAAEYFPANILAAEAAASSIGTVRSWPLFVVPSMPPV